MSDEDDPPRRGVKYNVLLPYGKELDKEAEQLFSEIKLNIAACLAEAEIRPGLVSWLFHLQSYIGLHGYNFSKQDHVELVKLLLDIVILPELDFGTVQKVASAICRLLKKKYLLTPNDLEIEWRPLFDLNERCFNRSLEYHGLVQLPQTLESQLNQLVRACRVYFPLSSTAEMLNEWLVDMCPYDDYRDVLVRRLQLFLPTSVPPAHYASGWKLWFEQLISLWRVNRHLSTEHLLTGLFARLAEDNVGRIDWEPYLADVFTRLLRSFNLPYGSGDIKVARSTMSSSQCESTQLTRWLVACLGGGSSAQRHFELLFKTIESFYHPSNFGRWTQKLNRFLGKLCEGFVDRVWMERYRKGGPWWYSSYPVPDNKKLTDTDIDAFVTMMRPIALIAMFSKAGSAYGCSALQAIAWLRPAAVVPSLLERLNDALYNNVTEPHRLTATLVSVGYVSRVLVLNHALLGTPINIPSLLVGCLPGIDSNDLRKTTVTFQLISTVVTLVPLVDCSSIADDVSPSSVQEICLSTAAFEDFALELLSRCFAVIENAVADMNHHRENPTGSLDENILEVGLASTFTAVFNRCSSKLFHSVLEKLYGLVTNRILDPVTGKLAATVVRCAVAANPEVGLRMFLPHFAKLALTLLEPEEVLQDEKVDNELQFSLILLSEIVRCRADGIRPHLQCIVRVLKRALQLNSRNGYVAASLLLRNSLRALVAVYPNYGEDAQLVTPTVDDPPVLHWGESEDLSTITIEWHTPSDDDMKGAKQIFDECVNTELVRLRQWCENPQAYSMTKEEVQRSLTILWDSLQGLGSCLPPLKGEAINVIGTKTSIFCNRITHTGKQVFSETLRGDILSDIERIVSTVAVIYEDDIKSFSLISRIIGSLTFYFGVSKTEFEMRYKGYKLTKQILDLRLCKSKDKHIRTVIIDRARLQHELRLMQVCQQFTSNHRRAMTIVFKMAISHYSQVRIQAQEVLNSFFSVFPRSYRFVLDEMCDLLVSSSMTHEQYKGVLYTLLGNKDHNIVTINNWHAMAKLWPSLVGAHHSEKPSIITLINRVQDQVVKYMETYPIVNRVPKALIWRAERFAGQTNDVTMSRMSPSEAIAGGVIATSLEVSHLPPVVVNGLENEVLYLKLVSSLTELIMSGKLHWRHHFLGLVMLKMLLRHDIYYKEDTVRMVVDHLVSEHLRTRKICVDILAGILYQQKKKMRKITLSRSFIEKRNSEIPLNETFKKCLEGGQPRPFNLFLQLNSANYPDTLEKWNKAIFIHKPYIGYCGLRDEIEVYAPDENQPDLPHPGRMNSVEQIIYDHFSNIDFVKKLLFYLAIEENKGRDKFDGRRVSLFKGLFRNYGDAFMSNFEDIMRSYLHISRQESEQRCALEILAGMVRGSKHWDFNRNQRLAKFVVPLFETGVSNMLQETMADWGACVATVLETRDCNKYYWFLELICKDVFAGSPFLQACKMFTLLGGLLQMRWRVQELNHRLLSEIMQNAAHPYLNVRERIAHLLAYIFAFDFRADEDQAVGLDGNDCYVLAPKSSEFLDHAVSSLQSLKLDNHEQEKEVAKRLFQTLLKWQASHCAQSYTCTRPQQALLFIPTACRLIADTTNEELQKDCGILFAILGYELLSNSTLHMAIEAVQTCLIEPFWKVRNYVVSLMLFVTYSNLFAISADLQLASGVKDIVFKAIADERVEVRITAQEALSGLIHCGLVEVTDHMLFDTKKRLRIIAKAMREKRNDSRPRVFNTISPPAQSSFTLDLLESGYNGTLPTTEESTAEQKLLIEYHAAVLQLCAAINAYPYDVPSYMPDVICVLAEHVNAPQPIPTTIKKTLSDFKRTHYDNWRDHKDKFSEEQLTVITDLLVSPSYYA